MKYRIKYLIILLIAFANINQLFSQTQMGEDIDAKEAFEVSGSSVSLSSDGNRVAIGATWHDAQGVGNVRLYEWDGVSWTQMGDDIEGEVGFDVLGHSVSLSSDGKRVAIGGGEFNGSSFSSGKVRVYEWDDGNWVKIGDDIEGEGDSDNSGYSVSLSSNGTRLAIGAPFNEGNGTGIGSGHVRVYEWNGGNWTKMGADIDGVGDDDLFGSSVSLSSDGSKVAVGAPENWFAGIIEEGYVQIYEWDGGNWVQMGADINGEAVEDTSGESVSLSSDGLRVAIGASKNDGTGTDAGHVRVYQWDAGNWIQMGTDINGEADFDNSGSSISLSSDGNRVAIGASKNDGTGTDAGHVRVYQWDAGNWIQSGVDINGEAEGDNSGSSVSLSSDGNRVAVGAPRNNGIGTYAGHVRVFEFAPVSTIPLEKKAKIEIFPNPTSGAIELFGDEFDTVKIIDNFGRVIWEAEKPETEIDFSDFACGIYLVQIKSGNQWITKKLIKI